jgi:hypothetical protein
MRMAFFIAIRNFRRAAFLKRGEERLPEGWRVSGMLCCCSYHPRYARAFSKK